MNTHLRVLRTEAIETFLDDVIAVEILNELYNAVLQSMNDSLGLFPVSKGVGRHPAAAYLFSCRDELDHLLQCPCTMLIQRNLYHLWRGIIDQNGALVVI